jgi:ribosome-associated protein
MIANLIQHSPDTHSMPRIWHKDPPPIEDDGIPSKTQRKHEMHALQDLGERLAELTSDKLAQLELPERLAIAINEYRRFNKWEAKRRQMQYIGRLMRDIDAAPVLAQLEIWAGTSRAAVAGFHAVEEWRERLLAEGGGADGKGGAKGSALDEFMSMHPEADRARIALLIDRARAERQSGRPPASFRLLFKELARLLNAEQRETAKTAPTLAQEP